MANLVISTTTTTLVLLAFLFLSPPTATAENAVDSEGDTLVAGSYYYMSTIDGGGITMFNQGSVTCPDFIVARSTEGLGIPVTFSPQSQFADLNVRLSSNVNVAFKFLSPQPLCRRAYTTSWSVDAASSLVVLEAGAKDGLFKLESDESSAGYKIVTGDNDMTVLSEQQENGEILLGVASGDPLYVVFVKA